jgi:hypothetical protein
VVSNCWFLGDLDRFDRKTRLVPNMIRISIADRTIMIFLGTWLIAKLHWILYIFGGSLLFAGIKTIHSFIKNCQQQTPESIENNLIIQLINKVFKITNDTTTEKFIIYKYKNHNNSYLKLVDKIIDDIDLIKYWKLKNNLYTNTYICNECKLNNNIYVHFDIDFIL